MCNKTIFLLIGAGFIGLLFSSCLPSKPDRLPFIGRMEIVDGDTLYHKIPPFRFVNQDSQWVTNEDFADQIYIADFFFTSCPSICPKVKKQMLRIYDKFQHDDRFMMLSHSIDTKRDTVAHLKRYATNLGVDTKRWYFLTGKDAEIFALADAYFVSAFADPNAPGGFDHSGRIILIDRDGHVRSYCDGTDPEEVTEFMTDIEQLLFDTYEK
jgi:protein SCO1/2